MTVPLSSGTLQIDDLVEFPMNDAADKVMIGRIVSMAKDDGGAYVLEVEPVARRFQVLSSDVTRISDVRNDLSGRTIEESFETHPEIAAEL